MNTDRILERIRRLLAMANGKGTSTTEAETAAAAARKLLDEHGMSIEQIQSLGDNAVTIDEREIRHPYRRMPSWQKFLAIGIAKGFDCHCVGAYCDGFDRLAFIGLEQDTAIALYLFTVFQEQIPNVANRAANEGTPIRGRYRKNYIKSFCLGAAERIGKRLQSARSPNAKQLIACKQGLIVSAHPHLAGKPKMVQVSAGSRIGFDDGTRYGERAHLGTDGIKHSNSNNVVHIGNGGAE